MKKMKRLLSGILSFLVLIGCFSFAASANYGDKVRRPVVSEVVNSDPENQVKTNTLRFYMPSAWRNDLNDRYNGYSLDSCVAGIYWWSGSYTSEDYHEGLDSGWPGFAITKTDEADSNIFVVDVPTDTTTIIFTNTVDGGQDQYDPKYVKAIQTENINTEGYDPGKDPYDFYPNGTIDEDDDSTWNFDGMIYVINPKAIEKNEFTGKETYKGCWFYYYGDGKYGIKPTLAEAEAAGAVYKDGKFPPYGLQVDEKVDVETGATATIGCNDSKATISGYDESIISVAQDAVTGAYSVTGLKPGTTTITFTVIKDGEFDSVDCVVTVKDAPTTVAIKADQSTIDVGAKTAVRATVTNSRGITTYKSSNTGIATVDSTGTVTGVSEGIVQITATNNGVSDYVTITVKKVSVNPQGSINTIIDNLIAEGNSLASDSSSNAYAWLVKVDNVNETYPYSSIHSRLQSETNKAQSSLDISSFNCKNKILGYLTCLKDELNNVENKTLSELLKEGDSIVDDTSPRAYKWVVDVLNTNKNYTDSSVYSKIQSEANDALSSYSISSFNCKNKIIGYLTILKDEFNENQPTEPETTEPVKHDISTWNIEGLKNKAYTGKVIKPEFDVVSDDGEYAEFKVKFKNNKNVGTATATITGTGDYTGTIVTSFQITKANQPMTAKAVTKAVKASVLKKSKAAVRGAITVKKAQGAVTYKKLSGSKYLTISKSGVITVKKGKYKKNTVLTASVKVTAKGGANYKSGSKTVKVKVKVK